MAIFGINRMERVAPAAAIIATAGPHENRRLADQRPLTLNGRAEYLADPDHLRAHGRYSAVVFGVSLTRTAQTSGQRAWHQS